jgi:hypothetical protein
VPRSCAAPWLGDRNRHDGHASFCLVNEPALTPAAARTDSRDQRDRAYGSVEVEGEILLPPHDDVERGGQIQLAERPFQRAAHDRRGGLVWRFDVESVPLILRVMVQDTSSGNKAGVENPNCIDLVTERSDGSFVLVMVETRPWDGSKQRIRELQAKIQSYVSFALDGAMAREYPDSVGRPVIVRLDTVSIPDAVTENFLGEIRRRLQRYGISLAVERLPE